MKKEKKKVAFFSTKVEDECRKGPVLLDTEDECDKKEKERKGPVLFHAEDLCAKVLCDSVVRIGQMC